MKKNLMSLAVAAGVAGVATTAQAGMYLDPEGTGQVLLFPYYNAVGTNETAIHIVNTTDDAKAVKVRILEYINSQEVLDFNLYMSPRDHFSFSIFQHPDGDNAALVTRDNSCTVPALGTATGLGGTLEGFTTEDGAKIQPFLPYQYQAEYSGLDFDARSQVGHVEVIEMGVLTNENVASTTAFNPAAWATHDSTGVPASCAKLVAAWSSVNATAGTGTWTNAASTQIGDATGGLYGLSNVLDSADASAFGIDAAAVDAFWGTTGSKHTDPGNTSPSLGEGDKTAIVTAGDASYTLSYTGTGGGWDAVSALFMSETISNDVMINPVLNGMTDWIVTFPTKREYVNTAVRSPFSDLYARGTKAAPLTYKATNLSCEVISISQWNREESTVAVGIDGPVFSPKPPEAVEPGQTLCLETNTIAMGAAGTASVTGTVLAGTGTEYLPASNLGFKEGEVEGWMEIGFTGTKQWLDAVTSVSSTDVSGSFTNGNFKDPALNARLEGLPVMGFAAYKYANGDRSYGFVSDHKTSTAGSAIHS